MCCPTPFHSRFDTQVLRSPVWPSTRRPWPPPRNMCKRGGKQTSNYSDKWPKTHAVGCEGGVVVVMGHHVGVQWNTFLRPLPVGAPRLGEDGAISASQEVEWGQVCVVGPCDHHPTATNHTSTIKIQCCQEDHLELPFQMTAMNRCRPTSVATSNETTRELV